MGEKPDRNIGLELMRATEAAALAASRWVGRGEKESGDQAAVDADAVKEGGDLADNQCIDAQEVAELLGTFGIEQIHFRELDFIQRVLELGPFDDTIDARAQFDHFPGQGDHHQVGQLVGLLVRLNKRRHGDAHGLLGFGPDGNKSLGDLIDGLIDALGGSQGRQGGDEGDSRCQ